MNLDPRTRRSGGDIGGTSDLPEPELDGMPPPPPKPTKAPHPAGFKAGHYTEADLMAAAAISKWLTERKQTQSWLATKCRTSSSTVNQVLKLKYPSPPAELLAAMRAVIELEDERASDGTPGYVEGSVHKLAQVVCDRTRKHANFGVLVGSVGVGKTRALREIKTRRMQTLLVEANPHMTAGTLLIELLEQLHVVVPHGLDRKFQALVKVLQGTNYLLIVDEAENMSALALHYLRRVRDKAGIGVVLSGTQKLHMLIRPENGQFDQIRSRVSMWPETIQAITRDDMDEMARMALADAPGLEPSADGRGAEVPDDVLDALWAYCEGSARVLMESLVPALRDYGYGRGAINAELVDAVASKVLFMQRRQAGARR